VAAALLFSSVDCLAETPAGGWEVGAMDESLFEFEPALAPVRYSGAELWTFHALAPMASDHRASRALGDRVEPGVGAMLSVPMPTRAWQFFAAPELELAGTFDAFDAPELSLPVSLARTRGRLTMTVTAARTLRRGDDEWSYTVEGAYSSATGCALSIGLGGAASAETRVLPNVPEYAATVECSVADGLSVHGKGSRATWEVPEGDSAHFVLAGVALRL